MKIKCNNCGKKSLTEILDLGSMPIAHRMLSSAAEAEDRFPLALCYCNHCGLIQIKEPISAETLYLDFNYCFSSWKPQTHIEQEIDTIFEICGKESIFEIACNDGLFLESLHRRGASGLYGLEPNPVAGKIAAEKGFTVVKSMLDAVQCKKVVEESGRFHTVVARQVLEHIPDLTEFFRCTDILLDDEGFIFIDIPDIEKQFECGDVTAVWEEHTNYFSETAISQIITNHGYRICSVKRYNFSGGIIAIIAQRAKQVKKDDLRYAIDKKFEQNALNYSSKVQSYLTELKRILSDYRNKGFNILLYGVGCRACTLVNGGSLKQYIDFAIDDQKERQGKFMPGGKIEVLPPESIKSMSKPVLCLLAVSQEHEDKVRERLKAIRNTDIITMSVLTPADIRKELTNADSKVKEL